MLRRVRPWTQAKAAEPLDLGLLIDRLCMASDKDAPACLVLLVIVIGLERSDILLLSGRQLRSSSSKEYRVLAVYRVIDGQYYDLAVCDYAHATYRHRCEQPQALLERQDLESCAVSRTFCRHRPAPTSGRRPPRLGTCSSPLATRHSPSGLPLAWRHRQGPKSLMTPSFGTTPVTVS
jgi:hypothetical protein